MKKLLYVDGCVHRGESRTEQLAQAYLRKRLASGEFQLETLVLEEASLTPLNGEMLRRREAWIAAGDFSDAYFGFAKSFAAASELVIAAPYWDLSFPAAVKMYLEQICVRNLTFRYSEQGIPAGLTGIRQAAYVTTAGGYIGEHNFGFDYVRGLLQGLFSIAEVRCLCAEGLDIRGRDTQAVLADAVRRISRIKSISGTA